MLRPYWLSFLAVVLFLTWAWISMSLIWYEPGVFFFGLHSSPWFFFGLPIMIGIGLIIGFAITHIARRTNPKAATAVLLVLSMPWIVYDFLGALPNGRVERTLNFSIPTNCHVLSVKESDSFNDGSFVSGTLQMNEEGFQSFLEKYKESEVVPNNAWEKVEMGSHLDQFENDKKANGHYRFFEYGNVDALYDKQSQQLHFKFHSHNFEERDP